MKRLGIRKLALAIVAALLLAAGAVLMHRDPGAHAETARAAATRSESGTRPAVRVRVVSVRSGRIEGGEVASGVVHAFRKTSLASETSGRVLERRVEPGDVVEGGQELVVLDAARLRLSEEQARATLGARRVDLVEAKRELERGEQLKRGNTIAESRHDALRFGVERAESNVELAEVALRDAQRAVEEATIRAPFAGTVESVEVDVGDYLTPGAPVATMVDLSRARVRAGVTAAEAKGLEVGGRAVVIFEDLGADEDLGEIQSIGRVADPATGTYTVEVWIDDASGALREGMVAQVRLSLAEGGAQPLIPRSALIRRDGRMSVFVIEGQDEHATARARRVRIGRSNRDSVEILDGASIGDRVVVDGLFALSDGARVLIEDASTPQG